MKNQNKETLLFTFSERASLLVKHALVQMWGLLLSVSIAKKSISSTMVSFSCEVCNDTVIKKKLDVHRQRCYGAYFTCIDCSTTFNGTDYKSHTQCISEAEKYEKALYKGKKSKPEPKKFEKIESKKSEKTESKSENTESKSEKSKSEKSKSEKSKSKSPKSVNLSKYSSGSLYKVIKDLSKDLKKDKKDVLKQLQVTVQDGKLVVSL